MDRMVAIIEYVTDIRPLNTHRPFLRDGGSLWQILNLELENGRYKVETVRGTFRRNPDELIVIQQREQRRTAKR